MPTGFTTWELARASELSYGDPAFVSAEFPACDVQFIEEKDSQAYVIRSERGTLVPFRGTQVMKNFSMTDVIRNAKITPVRLRAKRPNGPRVHRGYKEAVTAINDPLSRAIVESERPIYFTGHSLGGAVADLAGTYSPRPDMTVTFGAPKVGDRRYVTDFKHLPLIRVVHANDIAPKHARPWLGYRHRGTLLHISRSGKIVKRRWRWYDEMIIPFAAGLVAGTFDHRIGEYVQKLKGAEI